VIDLPQGFVESCFHDDIAPGTIFRAFITTTAPPKTKYFVLVARDPLCCFFINSTINQFKASKPHYRQQQVKLHQADYAFLDYDAWLDCSGIMEEFVDYDSLVSYFSAGLASSAIVGKINKADKKKVYDTVCNSSTLALRLIESIREEIRP